MRALIIDDEPMPAKHLREMIRQHCFEIDSSELIYSPIAAIEHLKNNTYDIIFLDVEMPEMNGFDFLKKVFLPKTTAVVFSTAYSEYAVEAFKANATHYIMKPVEEKDVVHAVRKVLTNRNQRPTRAIKADTITIFDGSEYSILNQSEIVYLKAEGSYTKFAMINRELLVSKRMGYFEEKLEGSNFIRCHNSYLVNQQQIEKVGKQKTPYVVMKNGDTIPVSASKKEELEKRLGLR